jgi:hypothetical protein
MRQKLSEKYLNKATWKGTVGVDDVKTYGEIIMWESIRSVCEYTKITQADRELERIRKENDL